MKQLSLTPIFRALRNAPYLYVLPLPKSLVPASLDTVIAVLFVLARSLAHAVVSRSPWHSPRQTSTPLLSSN